MQRRYVIALCLIFVTVGPIGCALNTSPGDQARTPQAFTQPSAFVTAVDVDILDDHTLITLQADTPLRYTLQRDETPSRLFIALPAHKIAPGVRPLEIFQGGIMGIYPHQTPGQVGSQIEI